MMVSVPTYCEGKEYGPSSLQRHKRYASADCSFIKHPHAGTILEATKLTSEPPGFLAFYLVGRSQYRNLLTSSERHPPCELTERTLVASEQ